MKDKNKERIIKDQLDDIKVLIVNCKTPNDKEILKRAVVTVVGQCFEKMESLEWELENEITASRSIKQQP